MSWPYITMAMDGENSDGYYPSMRPGVEWALHCCTLLAMLGPGEVLPSGKLAEFHDLPAPYLAKVLRDLSAAGVIEAAEGRHGGYRLARDPSAITLLDVVTAAHPGSHVFRCAEIRQRGPCAAGPGSYTPVCGIAAAMYRAEQAWSRELAAQTLADIARGVRADAPAEAKTKARRWFVQAIRPRRGQSRD